MAAGGTSATDPLQVGSQKVTDTIAEILAGSGKSGLGTDGRVSEQSGASTQVSMWQLCAAPKRVSGKCRACESRERA